MSAAEIFNFRPPGPSRRQAASKGPKVKVGDLVTWTNPNTQEEWEELVVETVQPLHGTCTVRGCFGRVNVRTGNFLIETRLQRVEHLKVTGRASEREAS